MKQKLKKAGYWASVITLGLVVGISLQLARANWSAPTATAPNGNAGAPINTGSGAQNKIGSIGTSGSLSAAGVVQGSSVTGTTQLCIGADCRKAWPAGGSGAAVVVNYGDCVTAYGKGGGVDWYESDTLTVTCPANYVVAGVNAGGVDRMLCCKLKVQ